MLRVESRFGRVRNFKELSNKLNIKQTHSSLIWLFRGVGIGCRRHVLDNRRAAANADEAVWALSLGKPLGVLLQQQGQQEPQPQKDTGALEREMALLKQELASLKVRNSDLMEIMKLSYMKNFI